MPAAQARIGSILRSERNLHRGARMLRFHELQQNPVSVTCRDENRATYTVVAMRLREGIVKMTCQCQRYSQEGWCRHCLAVFSDCEVFESKKHREAFEQLVGRTYLERAATKLTKALDDFAGAYRKMKAVSPSGVDRGQLKKFAEQAYRAGASADELAVALEKFIKEAEARGRGGGEKVYQGSRGSSRALGMALNASLASRWRRILGLITRSARARLNEIIWSYTAAFASSRSLSSSFNADFQSRKIALEEEPTRVDMQALMSIESVTTLAGGQGDPNVQANVLPDNATIEELKARVMMHLEKLAPVLEFETIVPPSDEIANHKCLQGGAGLS